MKFNDFTLSSEKECEILNKQYDNIIKQEVEDLNEIISKMTNQKENLESLNFSGEYTSIIDKLSRDIEKLQNLVHSTKVSKKTQTTYNLSVPSSFRKVTKSDNSEVVTPIRSIEENNRHSEYERNLSGSENTPKDPNIPSENNNNFTRRGRPMRSFGFANFAKKFALSNIKKESFNVSPLDKWKYHTIVNTTSCNSHKHIVHNQIDIIRLLLLYLTLRPHCKYTSIISTIANDQFENYITLTEIKNR